MAREERWARKSTGIPLHVIGQYRKKTALWEAEGGGGGKRQLGSNKWDDAGVRKTF